MSEDIDNTDERPMPLDEAISEGITRAAFEIVSMLFFVSLILWLISGLTGCDLESTDKSAWSRSGFTLMTDAATGCQYLKTSSGLTPRLDRAGKQMCGAP